MNLIRKPLLLALALSLSAPLAFAGTPTKTAAAEAAKPAAAANVDAASGKAMADTSTDAGSGKKSWADLDGDKDGNLTKAEASVVPSLAEVFEKADANADGSLTGDEYRAYVDANAGAQAESTQK